MTDTPEPETPHVTKRDLVEGKAEKVVSDRMTGVAITPKGGIDFSNLRDMVDAAKALATAGPMLRPWLQGNVGGCLGIIMRAQELGVSPIVLQSWTYIVEQWIDGGKVQQVAYESQFFHSLVEARAPITTRLNVGYEGEGDARKCRVWATFKGESEPRYFPPLDSAPDQFTLGKLRPKRNDKGKVMGSPLWDLKPDLQLFYNMSRDWARMYTPDIIAGMYGRDELEEVGYVAASEVARDVSPKLAERLRGAIADEGFVGERTLQSIDAAINAAKRETPVTKSRKQPTDGKPDDGLQPE